MTELTDVQKLQMAAALHRQRAATSIIPKIDFSDPKPFTAGNGNGKIAEPLEEPKKRKRGKFIDYDTVRMTALQWLQPNRIPLGKVTLFSGPPGIGKTSVSDDLIAKVTSGLLSDIPGRVLVLAEEDSLSDTKLPRLKAMGANTHLIKGLVMTIVHDGESEFERELALGSDIDLLREWLTGNPDALLVTIDPFSNYFGEANMNKEQDCRKVLMPLVRLAEEFNVAILLIGHFNKNTDGDAITRQGGATALTGVPRVVWNFTRDADNEGECLMASPKNPHLKSQRYRIIEKEFILPDGKPTKTGVVDWLGESTQTAEGNLDDLNDPERRKVKQAEDWLKENLRGQGKQEANVVIQNCMRSVRCCDESVKRASTKLKKAQLLDKDNREGVWFWWWTGSCFPFLQHCRNDNEMPMTHHYSRPDTQCDSVVVGGTGSRIAHTYK